jgi:hypothetical protein
MIQLNERWRVVESTFDPPQWLLQRLEGREWRTESWCRTRQGLLTAINEKVIRASEFYPQGGVSMPVEPDALDRVRNLPVATRERDRGAGGYQEPSGHETLPRPSKKAVSA